MSNLDISKIATIILAQNKLETNIKEYKVFYKTHLLNIKDRSSVLSQLYNLCIRFQKTTPKTPFLSDPDRYKLEAETETTIKKYFSNSVFELYNKQIPTPEPKRKIPNPENSFWITLLEGLSHTFETTTEQYKQEWAYKTNFLIFLNNCLFNYGLHPDILKRDPKVYKRYNFSLDHFYKSPKTKQTEFKLLLSPTVLESEFLTPYEKQLPIKFAGKLIPFKSIYQIKITTTLLLDDEIELFAAKNKFNWSQSNKDHLAFINFCQDETEELHRNPFLIEQEKEKFRNQKTYFVNPTRIDELRKIKSKKFDLLKLIQLCEELNNASSIKTAYSPTLLVRAIIDHTPPIFGFKNFSEVANNYKDGTKSFKKSMLTLDSSLRNIADNNIHSQARQKEVLPNQTQTDFTPELDLLLSEVIRILK
jgi:hypothetical protein